GRVERDLPDLEVRERGELLRRRRVLQHVGGDVGHTAAEEDDSGGEQGDREVFFHGWRKVQRTEIQPVGRRSRWQTLLPPKPLLLLRTTAGAASSDVRGRSRPAHAGSGCSRCAAPGMKRSWIASAQKAASIAPASDSPWPVSALVLLTRGFAPSNTARSASASARSP